MSSSPEKKRKRVTTRKKPSLKNKKKPPLVLPPQSTPNPSLPDDLLISCLARVSRSYYPTLSLVSKSFGTLLASPELYKTRSSLGHTESCLYVCLGFHCDPIPRWFTLCRKPDRFLTTKKKKKPSGYVLAKLPTPHSGPTSGLVTVGSNIYNIGGPINDDKEPSSSVSILDSRSNTWREGPSTLVKRRYPAASVLDGKIYVAGGCKDCSSPSAWMEVFDPKTQTWEFVSNPGAGICDFNHLNQSAGVDGKVYIFDNCDALAYEPREDRWERVMGPREDRWGRSMAKGWHSVIGNVLYCYHGEGYFQWYDTKVRFWRTLKGIEGIPKLPRYCARLADYGGKMAFLWPRGVASTGFKETMIWCAVISLERRNDEGDEGIWGKVEWQEAVFTVPKSCRINCALATTV